MPSRDIKKPAGQIENKVGPAKKPAGQIENKVGPAKKFQNLKCQLTQQK
jgi:hypothetical protein